MNPVPKTPVTVLQELCTKRGIIPTYQDLPNSATPHAPCFVCEVMCQDLITQGQGKSKKEAKHAAADSMLKLLAVADNEAVSSPYENKFKENAIGALTDYCEEYGLATPRYEFVREEGPAHDRRFTERCFVGSFGTETTERSKKQAKQVAALQMLTKLKDMVDPRVKEDIRANVDELDADFQAALAKFRNCEIVFNVKFRKHDLSTPIMDDHLRYHEYYANFKEYIDEFTSSVTENPEEKLSSLMEKMEIKYSLLPVKSKKPDVRIVILHIKMSPSLNVHHYGATYVEASNRAAVKALTYIKVMCVPPETKEHAPTTKAEFEELIGYKNERHCSSPTM